jgi:DNA-binding response OmpR family regulator
MSTLLYLDDEEPIGRVISRYFSRRGDRVLLAQSVEEAKVQLNEGEPTAILVDVQLGAECGVEFVTWLTEHRPELLERVTFVTGEHLDRYPVGYNGCTVDYPVIQKPFELEALASYIDSAGSRAQA